MSEKARPLYEAVVEFIDEVVEPSTAEFYRLGEGRANRWGWGEGQLELLDSLKAQAKARGLWNFFLPNAETGEGLSNLDYAYIAVELGKNRLASECLNCSAPDTGNMETLERYASEGLKEIAQLDGAFVIGPDGTVEAAARYIDASAENVSVSKGLGARHWAAAWRSPWAATGAGAPYGWVYGAAMRRSTRIARSLGCATPRVLP